MVDGVDRDIAARSRMDFLPNRRPVRVVAETKTPSRMSCSKSPRIACPADRFDHIVGDMGL
jgi:hypothetical protein